MSVRILYFAWLKDRIGLAEETIELPVGVTDVGRLVTWMRTRDALHQDVFAEGGRIRAAVNLEFASDTAAVGPGDEIAFFPPVTGG